MKTFFKPQFRFFSYRACLWIVLFTLIPVGSCDSEDSFDCLQVSGNEIEKTLVIEPFSRVTIYENLSLVIKQDANYSLKIKGGENLINDVEVKVIDDRLSIKNNNNCNWVRSYAPVEVLVTTPNLVEIRNASQFDISSEGVLRFPRLNLLSEDYNEPGLLNTGDFRLNIENTALSITFNNLSNAYLTGNTLNLNVSFVSGNSRLEAETFAANIIDINHRGSNDMIVFPVDILRGTIRSTGDVISVKRPAEIDVEQLYTGKLILID